MKRMIDKVIYVPETNSIDIGNNVEIDGNLQVNGTITGGDGGGGLKLWRHHFTDGSSYYDILMFTNKKVSQLSSNSPCIPLVSGGRSFIDIYYFTNILVFQGSAFLTYLKMIDGSLNYGMLNISNFEETITEYEP